MTQPHLLELAKQGDPKAIATLMNNTLAPQGIMVTAGVEMDCLSVFFTAARPLKATTLVTFVQQGVLRLEVASIRQVYVYGLYPGEEEPDWIETFVVDQSPTADAVALETLAHVSTSNGSMPAFSKPAAVSVSDHPTPQTKPLRQSRLALKPFVEALRHQAATLPASLSSALMAAKQMVAQLPQQDRPFKAALYQATPNPNPTQPPSVNYLKLSALVTLSAFVTGGAVALIANSYTLGNAEPKAGGKPGAIASGSQMSVKADVERTRNQQQQAAKNYLEAMNKAQQAFYSQHNRFAATLEELERFAAAPIALRSDYIYKLTVPSSTQAQLTAVPKVEGLKSYTAAAAIAKPTNRVVTAICASQQAAKVPPLVFQAASGAVQCPI